jgi:drug/metabolite transporter (DMT)-like permease
LELLLGVSVAVGYGTADFAGGLNSKRFNTWWSLILAQTMAFPVALVVGYFAGGWFTWREFALGILGGLFTGLAFGALYRALAIGPMGVVGALASGTSATIPVLYGLAKGETLGAVGVVGLIAVLASGLIIATSSNEAPVDTTESPASTPKVDLAETASEGTDAPSWLGPLLGAVAGACFGVAVIVIADEGTTWRLGGERIGIVVVAALFVLMTRPKLGALTWQRCQLLPVNGFVDVIATWLLIEATARLGLAVAGALQSIFPLFTALLAAIFLRERLRRLHYIALVMALTGAVLLST